MKRYRLPEEQVVPIRSHDRDPRLIVPAFVVLLSAPVAAYCWQGLVHKCWGWSLAGVVMGLLLGFSLWQAWGTGQIATPEGDSNDRRTNPFHFWFWTFLSLVGYMANVSALFLFKWPPMW